MSWAVDELAFDDMAVDDMAVDELTPHYKKGSLTGTNTPAYFAVALLSKKEIFATLTLVNTILLHCTLS